MTRIDAHLHVFGAQSDAFPREANADLPAARAEPVEKLLAQMAAQGVDQAVLVQIGGAELAQHTYLLHCLAAYPGRFQGIGLIPAGEPDPAAHMDRLLAAGVIGFRLSDLGGPGPAGAPLEDHPIYSVWAHAAVRDAVIWLYPRLADLPLVPRLLNAFPTVRVALNHLGVTPDPAQISRDELDRPRVATPMPPPIHTLLETLAAHPRLVVHLSGQYAFSRQPYPYPDLAAWHQTLYRRLGAQRLLWASDFPWIVEAPGYGALLELVDHLLPGLSAAERDAILGGNAQRFLRFPIRAGGI
jgi:L-fuconolactonase